jgi:hypothetical protein
MRKFLYITLILDLFLLPNISFSCGDQITIMNTPPSYIDYDYIEAFNNYSTYDRYNLLLSQYNITLESNNNTNYEDIDNIKKKFIESVSKLLKSKNVKDDISTEERFDTNYYTYYSAVCSSNNYEAAMKFFESAINDPLVKDGYKEIAELRLESFNLCHPNKDKKQVTEYLLNKIQQLKTRRELGHYPFYVEALVYFYNEQFDKAREKFSYIANSSSEEGWFSKELTYITSFLPKFLNFFEIKPNWLKETSAYMLGRVYLIEAQLLWDGFSDPAGKINQELLVKADFYFGDYVRKYPTGIYANAAKGIKRKILWLQGNQKTLDELLRDELKKHLSTPTKELTPRMEEFMNFFKGDIDIAKDHPLITTYLILAKKPFMDNILKELEKYKDKFDPYPNLYSFIKTSILYNQEQYQQLLDYTKDLKVIDTPAEVSKAIMRARSQAKLGKYGEAISLLHDILKVHKDDIIELQLASFYTDTNNLENLFRNQIFSKTRNLEYFLHFAARDNELEELLLLNLDESYKTIIGHELFARYLITNQMQKMANLYDRVRNTGIFGIIKDSVHTLARNEKDAISRAKLGTFLVHNYDKTYNKTPSYIFEEIKPYCKKCKNPIEIHKTSIITPYDHLTISIDQFIKSGIKEEAEAEALFHLNRCFKSYNFSLQCQWNKEYKNVAKHWYMRLHKLYPDSKWAKEAKYHY